VSFAGFFFTFFPNKARSTRTFGDAAYFCTLPSIQAWVWRTGLDASIFIRVILWSTLVLDLVTSLTGRNTHRCVVWFLYCASELVRRTFASQLVRLIEAITTIIFAITPLAGMITHHSESARYRTLNHALGTCAKPLLVRAFWTIIDFITSLDDINTLGRPVSVTGCACELVNRTGTSSFVRFICWATLVD